MAKKLCCYVDKPDRCRVGKVEQDIATQFTSKRNPNVEVKSCLTCREYKDKYKKGGAFVPKIKPVSIKETEMSNRTILWLKGLTGRLGVDK